MRIIREILWPLIAVFAAFVVGGIIILLLGDNPINAYSLLLSNSFGSLRDIGWTLHYATPLIFTGLAVAVAFRCGLLNIGAEGQLYVAAFATAWVGITFGGTVVDVFGTKVALHVTSSMFEVMGARSATRKNNFDRFWRNVRTHSLHNPIEYKRKNIGRWVLTGEYPTPTDYS